MIQIILSKAKSNQKNYMGCVIRVMLHLVAGMKLLIVYIPGKKDQQMILQEELYPIIGQVLLQIVMVLD